jgi:hypothetical protein
VELELQISSHENVSLVHCRGKLIYGPEAAELVRIARQVLETAKANLQVGEMLNLDASASKTSGAI